MVEKTAYSPSSARERWALAIAMALFFASGFAALLYQVIWQRMLGMFSGVDMFSVTIIVAAYMAGLGLGSLAGGHVADRLSRRWNLLLLAGVQLGVALFALGSKALYYDWLYLQHYDLARSPVVLALTLFLSLLWPTFLMGMSLPLLARALTREIAAAARTVGALYGLNTLGAAAGSLLTTWVILRHLSFEASLRLGAALNVGAALGIALLAVLLWKGQQASQSSVAAADAPPLADGKDGLAGLDLGAWLAIYALAGFVALSLEMVWFRLLGIMLKSTAFTFGTLLAVYLLGLAIGALLGIPLVRRSRRPGQAFLALQAGSGIYSCLSLIVLWAAIGPDTPLAFLWRYFGEYDPLDIAAATAALRQLLTVGAVDGPGRLLVARLVALYVALPAFLVGPPTVMMGLSFPYLQRVLQRDAAYLGRRLGWLQAANIAGCAAGTVLTGWGFLAWFGTSGSLRLLLGLTGVFVLLWLRGRWGGLLRSKPAMLGALVALVALGSLVPGGSTLWARLHGTSPDRIIYVEDGSGLSLLRSEQPAMAGAVTVFANGRGESWLPYGGIHAMLGALPALLHPNPQRLAVIGLGSGNTLFHLAGRPETVELVSIEIISSQLPTLHLLEERRGYPALAAILRDPRIRHVVGDGRVYIMQQERGFDIIEADALRPNSAFSGNLYSEEYFRLLREHLAPGGFAVTWSPTLRTRDTFIKVFPHVLSLGGVILVGSEEPVTMDVAAIERRLEHPFTREHYARSGKDVAGMVRAFIREHRPEAFSPEFDRSALRDTNSDLWPKDEFMVPRLGE